MSSNDKDDKNNDASYEVGYGNPPKHTRFEKGTSGNPKGRPKGSRNIATILERALNAKVVVNENGKRKVMSKQDAAVGQLVNRAASGDLAALRLLIVLVGTRENQVMETSERPITEEDEKVFENLLNRIKGSSEEPDEDHQI